MTMGSSLAPAANQGLAENARQHWMVAVARRAELAGSERLVIPPTLSTEAAWARVCEVCRIREDELTRHVADYFKLPLAQLSAAESHALKLVPETVARRHRILPLRQSDRQLVVATANPGDFEAEQAIGFVSSRTPVFEVALPSALNAAVDIRYSPDRAFESLIDTLAAGAIEDVKVLEEKAPETLSPQEFDTAPVVKLTNLILQSAVGERASDIHMEPGTAGSVVRFRVDGVMRVHMQLPSAAMTRVVSRMKILAKLDIADRHRPQDGRARIEVRGKHYDLRISTVPTRDAEKLVIRVLDPSGAPRLAELDMLDLELKRFRQMLTNREGIVIVTGPTGSGKTTTLYAAIRELATGQVNIMTVEDPVEYEVGGITQIQVEPKRGVTFPSALRAILRQDPDVVFVGEIRDLETAEVAVQAAMTGHLVLATLHTNDALGVIPRLVDLGLDRASIAGALRGIVAQRLVRRLCAKCVQPIDGNLTANEARLASVYGLQPPVRATGCEECGMTGYRGRTPVNEVFLPTSPILETIAKGATVQELQRAVATTGMRPIREVALEKVRLGSTTLEEMERVLGERISDAGPSSDVAPVDQARILLVDDDPTVRALARLLLEKNGFHVTEVGDGPAALEHLNDGEECALVVLDLNLPTLSGLDVLGQLRSTPSTAGVPVVVLTGSEGDEAEINAMNAGADDYIRKPLEPARFVARIKAALRRAGS
jgi:type II secretory ATPase GspE/PulE/Tfp pilus assembly ATPase PilB-like protein/ActR/RegA family two-component response regulator